MELLNMNDFTKDELNLLIYYIGFTMDQEGRDLSVKIQSIIDNYCEHEFIINTNSPHIFMMCNKCNKIYVDDTFPG